MDFRFGINGALIVGGWQTGASQKQTFQKNTYVLNVVTRGYVLNVRMSLMMDISIVQNAVRVLEFLPLSNTYQILLIGMVLKRN